MHVYQLFTLSEKLPANMRLFVVKSWGLNSYRWIFHCLGDQGVQVSAPTSTLLKGQLYFLI